MIWQTLHQSFDAYLVASSQPGSLSLRIAKLVPRLIYQLSQPHDIVVIGFYGHPLSILARRLTKAPIIFDAFVSTYDTLCSDRQVIAPNAILGHLAFQLDKQACQSATKILLDTKTHAEYFQKTFSLPKHKIETFYLGCDENLFCPISGYSHTPFTVFTYSTYLPLHGMETIVEAANLCRNYPIQFRLVGGNGFTYQKARQLAAGYQLTNVEFVPSMPFSHLPKEIAKASICLGGHFGHTPKAKRVISGKTYQFIAMNKAVILGDNPANRELFCHGQTAYLCPMDNPAALADAIISLFENPDLCTQLATGSLALYRRELTRRKLGEQLNNLIYTLL